MIRLLGLLWWWILPVRKRLAIANFSAAFPGHDPRVLQRTVGEMVWGYVELLLDKPVQIENADVVRGGGICLAGHGGAWDLALISAGREVPITVFVRTPTNPLAAALIKRLRSRAPLQLLEPRGTMDAATAALEQGRLIIFIQDQRWNSGIPVRFFGREAWTSVGFAAMAHRTRAPLFSAWQWRDEDGHHLRFEPLSLEIPAARDQALGELTQASQQVYEEKIRSRPHSWLWLHDRWRRLGNSP